MYRYNINSNCTKCILGSKEGTIGGQSEVPFSEVKLIVIGNYPTGRDLRVDSSFSYNPNSKGIPDSSKGNLSSGEFLRYSLNAVIDKSKDIPDAYKPITKYTYFTNALKCSPQRGRDKITVLEKHIRTCKQLWLNDELDQFPDRVPILLCSNEAVKSILGKDAKLYDSRNKINYYKSHPVIVSTHPTEWEKYSAKHVPDIEEARQNIVKLIKANAINKFKKEKKINKIIGCKRWKPLPGSPLYFVKQDLSLILEEIIKYVNQ